MADTRLIEAAFPLDPAHLAGAAAVGGESGGPAGDASSQASAARDVPIPLHPRRRYLHRGFVRDRMYVRLSVNMASMNRWNLVIADDTNRLVRSYLARTGGKKGDLSRFVDRAVRQAIFWETVEAIWKRNEHLTAEAVRSIADEAVADARADPVL